MILATFRGWFAARVNSPGNSASVLRALRPKACAGARLAGVTDLGPTRDLISAMTPHTSERSPTRRDVLRGIGGLGLLSLAGGAGTLLGACAAPQSGAKLLETDPERAAPADLRSRRAHPCRTHDGRVLVPLERLSRDPEGAGQSNSHREATRARR